MGKTRLRKSFVELPETVINLPDGKSTTLRRNDKEVMPLFRKFDPKTYSPATGKKLRKGERADNSSMPSVVPFSRVLITAFLVHQLYGFLKGAVGGWRKLRGKQQPQQQQLVTWEEGIEEDDLDEAQREQLAAAKKAQAVMARAMLRNALPKPQRAGLPQRAAQARSSNPRPHATAKQMMHPQGVNRRPKGMLEKVDDAMQKEMRAALAALHRRQLQQQALPAPAQVPALPSTAQAVPVAAKR